ncbi:LysE family translocator [Desulfobaculum bizertense]|uniref:LysE family translocator n=1 Tax=Desulfobaculum bizertense TaxID=376490 RepID=UPI001F34EFDD|nr:LysE family translocator [Desulfobaculum bizertense]UIJ36777.1 LysE family translocator [Desulfobaculum bizertense]
MLGIGLEQYMMFMAAVLLLNLTPGPDMIYVATRSAAQGRGAGLASALAIACGGVLHTCAAALGLSAVLMHSALAYDLVRWAGAAYLVWMGLKMLRSGGAKKVMAGANGGTVHEREPLWKLFRQGLIVAVLNPKVALFFLSFLPQFANPNGENFTAQLVLLGLSFCMSGFLVLLGVVLCCGAVRTFAAGRPGLHRFQNRLTGGIFITLGICLGFAKRS